MKMSNSTSVTKAVFVQALVHIVTYIIEAITGTPIPSEIQASLATVTLGMILWLLPSDQEPLSHLTADLSTGRARSRDS